MNRSDPVSITFLGAAETVTGSMFGLSTPSGKILVDCGLYQGRRQEARKINKNLPDWTRSVDAVVLTHAHIDHSGNLPTLVKNGFKGPIFTTPATRDLCQAMLRDSARIQLMDAKYLNRKHADDPNFEPIEPLYTEEDAVKAVGQIVSYPYWSSFEPLPGVRAAFHDAGHVLGSASVVMEVDGIRICFSGDIGRKHLPILRDPEIPANVDYLVMESTYGNREHGPIEEMHGELARVINETAKRKGKIVIPSFALERTQEVVYALNEIAREGKIKPVPIYVDSPLAVNLTQVFKNHPECFDMETLGFLEDHGDPFGFESLHYVQSVEESMRLNTAAGPIVIISASGMCEAGRILHHLRNSVEDKKNTIVIVGFQAEHTLGRRIVERRKQIRIFGVMRDLNARVEVLDSFSAHGGRSDLLEYARLAGPDTRGIFLVHGEPEAQKALADTLIERGHKVVIPVRGQRIELQQEKQAR